MDWYILAIISMLIFGVQHFLFKVAAQRGHSSIRLNTVFMLTVAVLSGIFYLSTNGSVNGGLFIIFVIGNAATYMLANICKIESFRITKATIAAPIAKLYMAITPILAFFIFRERISSLQIIGLCVATFAIVILGRNDGKVSVSKRNLKLGIIFAVAAAASTSINNLIGKSAALSGDILSFMFFSYMFSFIIGLILQRAVTGDENPIQELIDRNETVRLGIIIGLVNFAAYYILLKALVIGPAMVVIPIIGLSTGVTIFMSWILMSEKPTPEKAFGILACILAIFLLRA